ILFNITEPLIGLADIAIIGQIGENATQAQGGVGLAAGLIATLIWGLAQMRTSLSAIISKHFGQGDVKPIISLIPQTLLLSALMGILIAFTTAYFYDNIALFLYGKMSALTFDFSNEYFVIRSIGLPISLLIALFFGIFRGFQNTLWAMYISLIGGTVNIVLDLILVLGIEGFIVPMGVAGVAWASVSAQILMLLLCIVFLYRYTPFDIRLRKTLNPLFGDMLKIFVNMFIRTIVLNIVFILANRYANKNGDIQLAAYTIGYNIWIFSSFFIDGFANAGNALAGKYLGAGDKKTLAILGKKLMSINLMLAGGLSLVYICLSPVLGSFLMLLSG
ncbi:MAG TPA: MATE family efflux transporter, partial [Bacteroidetes bacterium]|nr:MATE family efflux transporter [Bacteroidota bacterium]